jgi:hypothetical protein
VGGGELRVQADGLVEHLDGPLQVRDVEAAQHVGEEQVASPEVELVGLRVPRERPLDLLLLLGGGLHAQPLDDPGGDGVLEADEVRRGHVDLVAPLDLAVVVETSWAVTGTGRPALRNVPTSTRPTPAPRPPAGVHVLPTYGAMYDEGRTTSEPTCPRSVITPSARPNS